VVKCKRLGFGHQEIKIGEGNDEIVFIFIDFVEFIGNDPSGNSRDTYIGIIRVIIAGYLHDCDVAVTADGLSCEFLCNAIDGDAKKHGKQNKQIF